MIKYDSALHEAFKRTNEFCKKRGLEKLETIFLLSEIVRTDDCMLFKYLTDECGIHKSVIKKTLEQCINERVKQPKTYSNDSEIKTIRFTFDDAVDVEYKLTYELAKILRQWAARIGWIANQMIEQYGEEIFEFMDLVIKPNLLLAVFLDEMPDDLAEFIRKLELTPMRVKVDLVQTCIEEGIEVLEIAESDSQETSKEVATDVIPSKASKYLKEFTAPEAGKKLILGRDAETKKLWNIISKRNKKNAILVGDPGVGKTAIVEKMDADIQNGECPEKFRDYKIIALDMTGVIAGTKFRGQAEERFNQITDFLSKNDNIILFIDEIHTMLGAGSCEEGGLDLSNAMKPILASEKGIVIGATTTEEYEKYFSRDGALKRRFEKVLIKEPKSDKVYAMIKNQIANLEEYHGVKISKKIVDFIIFTSACFNFETRNPDRTLDLIDRSMVEAVSAGNSHVTKKNVLDNFNVNYKLFENMSEETRKATAYHEAGHFVIYEKSDFLKDTLVTAVSILPTDDYLGVNVTELTDKRVDYNLQYYIDRIAMSLAGREAERLISSEDNSGVRNDLKQATALAYNAITEYALVKKHCIAYLNDEHYKLLTEKSTNKIKKEVKKLLKKGKKRAKELLSENRELLDRVANELLEKKMLSRKDLDLILNQTSVTTSE